MTKQTIAAHKGSQTKTFEVNYKTGMAVVRDATGARHASLDEAMLELRALPEQGWNCL